MPIILGVVFGCASSLLSSLPLSASSCQRKLPWRAGGGEEVGTLPGLGRANRNKYLELCPHIALDVWRCVNSKEFREGSI